MREILFRGKRIDIGKWAFGYIVPIEVDYWDKGFEIIDIDGLEYEELGCYIPSFISYRVIPETVGQFTGLTDKTGKKIFEGDIVHVLGNQQVEDWKNVNYNALIAFIDGGFCAIDGTIEDHGFRRYGLCRMDFDLEIIGNIHDNPELLEVPHE